MLLTKNRKSNKKCQKNRIYAHPISVQSTKEEKEAILSLKKKKIQVSGSNRLQPVKPCLQQQDHEGSSKPERHTPFPEATLGLDCEDQTSIFRSLASVHPENCISMAKLMKMH